MVKTIGRAPNVVKIDVEGEEVDVLNGGMNTLSSAAPVLLVEVHSDELARQTHNLLAELGYTISTIGSDRFLLARPSSNET